MSVIRHLAQVVDQTCCRSKYLQQRKLVTHVASVDQTGICDPFGDVLHNVEQVIACLFSGGLAVVWLSTIGLAVCLTTTGLAGIWLPT